MLAGSRYKVNKWTIICPGLSEKCKRRKSDRAVTHNLFIVKTARSVFGKNHDELITPTDRVIRSLLKKSRYLHYVPILYESSVMAKSIL